MTADAADAATPDASGDRADLRRRTVIRRARTADVRGIRDLVAPLAARRVLVSKEAVTYFESLQEFRVAELDGRIVGCGALHVMWEDLAEIRTLAVADDMLGTGLGGRLLEAQAEHLRKTGTELLLIQVLQSRPELHSWYRRHGFSPTGRSVPFAGDADLLKVEDLGMDVMERSLRES